MDAQARWLRTWSHAGAEAPATLLEELLAAYAEPHRAYHTVDHLTECFEQLDGSGMAPSRPAVVELALWFHDAIYDTKADDNEARSADWSRRALTSLDASVVEAVASAILVTRHESSPANDDEALLLDVDLSILGSDAERFARYEDEVRAEYAWVPDEVYRAARRRILAGFVERPAIFCTPHFRGRLEARARENLARSIEALTD